MQGLQYVFIFYAVSAGIATLLSLGVGNTDLNRKKVETSEETGSEESSGGEEGDSHIVIRGSAP